MCRGCARHQNHRPPHRPLRRHGPGARRPVTFCQLNAPIPDALGTAARFLLIPHDWKPASPIPCKRLGAPVQIVALFGRHLDLDDLGHGRVLRTYQLHLGLFAVDLQVLQVTRTARFSVPYRDGKRLGGHELAPPFQHGGQPRPRFVGQGNPVGYLEAGRLAHGLDPMHEFAGQPFLASSSVSVVARATR